MASLTVNRKILFKFSVLEVSFHSIVTHVAFICFRVNQLIKRHKIVFTYKVNEYAVIAFVKGLLPVGKFMCPIFIFTSSAGNQAVKL